MRVADASPVRIAHYPPGAGWGPRTLERHELVWILSGSATWTIDHGPAPRAIALTTGAVSLGRPGTVESFAWDGRRHSAHAWVDFDVDDAGDLPPASSWPLVRHSREHEVLGALCSYLLQTADVGTAAARARSTEVLRLLVDLFVTGPFPRPGAGITSPVVVSALDHVRDRWEQRGTGIVALAEVAAAAGVSAGHLGREFRREFRTGPSGALELVRLASAAIALQRTTMTLDQVARSTGFADAYHLSRRFSRAYGLPPGRFRRLQRPADPLEPLTSAGLTAVWRATLGRPPSGRRP